MSPKFHNLNATESMTHWKSLPRLEILSCEDYNTIPIVQWMVSRDGPFEEWDNKMTKFYNEVSKVPWEQRQRYFTSYSILDSHMIDVCIVRECSEDRFVGLAVLTDLVKKNSRVLTWLHTM